MRQKRFVVVDGDALERLLHIDRLAHVVKCPLLALLERAHERDALAERVIPREVGVPRE